MPPYLLSNIAMIKVVIIGDLKLLFVVSNKRGQFNRPNGFVIASNRPTYAGNSFSYPSRVWVRRTLKTPEEYQKYIRDQEIKFLYNDRERN